MHLSPRVLGSTVVNALSERAGAPVLTIGSDKFRRLDLAAVECFNFTAAMHLSAAVAAIGGIKNTRDLFERIAPSELVLPGVGAIALAVLGAAFENRGIGGTQPLETWMYNHRAEGGREFLTFHTLKAQEKKREPGEARARKQRAARTGARRDQAQRLRVERFAARSRKGE